MAISREVKVKIIGDKSLIDSNIYIYRNDSGIDLYFTVSNFNYVISSLTTPVRIAGATVKKPDTSTFEVGSLEVIDGKVKFTITHEMTDELQEVGIYKVQIHFYDELNNRISIPYIDFQVLPLVGDVVVEGDVARADYAIVDKSVVGPDYTAAFTIERGYIKTIWSAGDLITSLKLNKIEAELEAHAAKLDELLYVPISISSFSISRSTAEIGESVSGLKLSWSYSKDPTEQKLDGSALDLSLRSHTIATAITSNRSFSLWASDGKTNVSRSAAINFYNGRYAGVSASEIYNRDLILSLNKTLTSGRTTSFTVNCGAGQYIYFAIPSRFGTPTFTVGGFSGGFSKVSTLDFKNNSGYTESYDIWKSTNSNLGNTTVVVG